MKEKIILPSVFLFLMFNQACQKMKNDRSEIRSDYISATFLLPDAEKGYYRGTRFDWSGVISDLSCCGHTYFGKWFDNYSPTLHDAIMGPVEEFAPLGYDSADPGGNFVMIGIGLLKKPDDQAHNRFGYYQITDPGKWKIKTKSDEITFNHVLKSDVNSYDYTKTVRLAGDKPIMVIDHKLRNTGKTRIVTNVYNHHFFVIDNQPVGPDFTINFPFKLSGEGQGFGSIAELNDNSIIFNRVLEKDETVFCGSLTGFSSSPQDLDVRIENKSAGAGVKITGNRPLSKLIFWACRTTPCPETYVDINIEPGKEFTWKFIYEFYSF